MFVKWDGSGSERWEWIDGKICAADQAIFGSVMVWYCVLKLFCSAYICIYNKFYTNLLWFYWILWVLVSTFKYLWTHRYLRTHEFLTHGSESPSGWNPRRSRYGMLNLKYPWVRIRVTRECTCAHPYDRSCSTDLDPVPINLKCLFPTVPTPSFNS